MRRTVVPALVLVAAACTGGDGAAPTVSQVTTTTTTSASPASTLPPVVECPGVGEFEEGGGIADLPAEGSDSRRIGRISWERNDRCETFHFDFETSEGAPATTAPGVSVDHLESFQVIRINLDINGTVITDQLVETDLVDRLYVVRSLSGGTFIDLHLAAPAAARASVSSSPARLSLELRPGFVPFMGNSTVGENIVLTSPASPGIDGRVQLLGYARTSEDNVMALATQDDEVVAEATTNAADSVGTWGEYRIVLSLPPGEVSVFVGEEDPEEGGLRGVTVDLTVN